MHDFWHTVRTESAGPLLAVGNALGFVLVLWLCLIA
jgi:hypothetical protein